MRTLPGKVLSGHSHFVLILLICIGLLLAVILVVSCDLNAQDGSTSLQGVIEDATGARIAAASITVSDPNRGLHLKTITDGQGTFNFGMLPPGRYDVTASAPGMATRTSRGVELLVRRSFDGAAAPGSGSPHPNHHCLGDPHPGGNPYRRRIERCDTEGDRGSAAKRPAFHGSRASLPRRDPGPTRAHLRFQRRLVGRRRARLPKQLSGRWDR